MLRLPVIFVLIISMFVASVPVDTSQKDEHDKSVTVETVDPAATVKNGATNISTGNNTTTVASPIKSAENKSENLNDTKKSEPAKTVAKVNETVPQQIEKVDENEKDKCNSTKEQDDMRGCYVLPHDSEENTDDNSAQITTEFITTTKDVSKKTEANETSEASSVEGKTDVQKKNDTIEIQLLNVTETTHSVAYDVVSTEAIHVKSTNDTEENINSTVKPITINDTAIASNSVAPLIADKITNVESEGVVKEVKSADRNKSMSSGVIALVIAISFGVAIAMVYIGMIVWRRYIEYRYGHRELLVNELEFDTNDLRHFEL